MKRDNWCKIEGYIEGLTATVQDFEDGEISKASAISDIIALADNIYAVCEQDYCDAECNEITALLQDIKPSLAEMLSLKETIWKWRNEHGYPNP